MLAAQPLFYTAISSRRYFNSGSFSAQSEAAASHIVFLFFPQYERCMQVERLAARDRQLYLRYSTCSRRANLHCYGSLCSGDFPGVHLRIHSCGCCWLGGGGLAPLGLCSCADVSIHKWPLLYK